MSQLLKQRIRIDSIGEQFIGTTCVVAGWVVTARWQAQRTFIKLSDSAKSKLAPLQIVCQQDTLEKASYFEPLAQITAGTSIVFKGQIIKSPAKGQLIEMQADEFFIFGKVLDPTGYPLAKGTWTPEALRQTPHLECHSLYKASIYSIRSVLMRSTELFFELTGYGKRDMPLITFSECEGGCQPMQMTLTLTSGKVCDIPVTDKCMVDFKKDFFGKKAYATVSAQLELETQLPLGDSYTVTRAVRGEPSMTTKHLTEFTMIELEKVFSVDATDIMKISEEYIKFCIEFTLRECAKEFEYISHFYAGDKTDKDAYHTKRVSTLLDYIKTPFVRITHAQAVEMMLAEKQDTFSVIPCYYEDLCTEHEKWIVRNFKKPVIVTRFPKAVKAFYMPVISETQQESHGVEHVDSFDILVPGVGELVGGSQRIHNASELKARIAELGLDPKPLDFYISLRETGTIPHGGMGIGFERLIKFFIGVDEEGSDKISVKDCVPFPRFIGCGKDA